MRTNPVVVPAVLVAALVPLVLVGNVLWVLFTPWLVDFEYALPGFPDTYAEGPELSDHQREDLADTGIESVRPFGEGVEALRVARLPGGGSAFTEREVTHMQDVRDLVGWLLAAWAVGLAAALGACAWLRRRAGVEVVRRALVRGAALTAALIGLIGVVMLIDFEVFFDAFHGVFFEGDSWRFNETYVLRSLYPDYFWGVAGGLMAVGVLAQAAALALIAGRGPGGARSLLRGPWASAPGPGE